MAVCEKLLKQAEQIMDDYGRSRSNVLPILTEIQDLVDQHYIPEHIAEHVALYLSMPVSQVYEVITFYAALSDKPKGKHVVQVCDSTVCRLSHNEKLVAYLEKKLGIAVGTTRSDGHVTLEYTPCFGACDMAPAIRINKKVYGHLTEDTLSSLIDEKIGGMYE